MFIRNIPTPPAPDGQPVSVTAIKMADINNYCGESLSRQVQEQL